MQKKMVFQVGLFTEPSMADMTLKWPGSSVHICVRFEIAWSWKGFGTHCAFVWFFLKNVKKEKRYLKELCFCFLFKRGREIIQYWSQLSHVSSIFLTLKVDNEWYRNRRLATARKRPLSHKNWHFVIKQEYHAVFIYR